MNERLREFERASGLAIFGLGARKEIWDAALTKYAELIIRESGVALNPMLRDMVSRGQAYELIKQHFGVEE